MALDELVQGADTYWRARFGRARRYLASDTLIARLDAELSRMDPAAPLEARILVGAARVRAARRVGVFSGSFNPLTAAHVALVEVARRVAALGTVIWLYAARTVDKERVERAMPADRLAQMLAFTRAYRGYALALTNRGLYVEEARALRVCLAPGAELSILVGFDKIVQIFDPSYYTDREAALRDLFAEARILVAPRAGAGRPELAALLSRPENQPYAQHVAFIEMPPVHAEDSSTEARHLASAHDWQRLIPLLPPEGVALAATGAYAAPGTGEAAAYTLREEHLRAAH
jgi:nicotinic acid mononucleotide adenylyltransferase